MLNHTPIPYPELCFIGGTYLIIISIKRDREQRRLKSKIFELGWSCYYLLLSWSCIGMRVSSS